MRHSRPVFLMLVALAMGVRLSMADQSRNVRSVSGQFTILASLQALPSSAVTQGARDGGLIQLVPSLTAVSCERVKASVLRQLKLNDVWKGRVTVVIVPATVPDQNPAVSATLFKDGWFYRVEMPSEVKPERFIRAVVQVVLLEIANRTAGDRSAEIPLWLGEGVTQHVLASDPDALLHADQLTQPTGIRRDVKAPDPLAKVRKTLAARPALTFDELSWPKPEYSKGEWLELFQHSSQLFVHQLARLDRNATALREFLATLPANLNWQTTFLRAFKPRFGMLLDVEKWWAVNIASFTGRNQWQMWAPEVAGQKLDDALLVEVETRAASEAIPSRSTVRLQTALREWDARRQRAAMESALNRLNQMRHNVPPELISVVDDYRAVFETYLGKREKIESSGNLRNRVAPTPRAIATESARRLDALDQRREMWRREFSAAAGVGQGGVP